MSERRGSGRRRPGAAGMVVIVALVAIIGAWLVTMFGGGVAGAYDRVMDRMFAASDEELREASQEYIDSFNYEGSDGDEFREQVERTVVKGSFYNSYVGEFVEDVASGLDNGDSTWKADYELTDFEVQSAGRDEATAVVEFEQVWSESGEITSETVSSEEVDLTKTEDGWKVAGAGEVETLEDNTPEEEQEASEEDDEGSATTEEQEDTAQSMGSDERSTEETTVMSSDTEEDFVTTDELEAELSRSIEDYYQAVDEEDWTYTYDHLDSETQEGFSKEEWAAKNQFYEDGSVNLDSVESDVSLDTSSEVAEATVTRSFESGAVQDRETEWVQEDGEWKHRFTAEEDALFLPDASYEEFVKAKE